ncbi:hypothetical protein [Bosea sp. PAMC 26642]|uniref:hypothetical protein n=1 Tax=Bosea sp. (strain PAMC 26642) TaxID=1792307 RepID=UPI00077006EA|nr:hypothetical protein [Bosea sp. PAMC 26642]AMJ61221.1 hypothetical protein AXW83_13745 [Bosea sp. PAMC 26642]
MMRQLPKTTAYAGLLVAALAAPALAQSDSGPLDKLFPRDEPICYARFYDQAHLRANPQQSVTSIRLLRDYPILRLEDDWTRRYGSKDGRTAYSAIIVTYRDTKATRFAGGPNCTTREGGEIYCSASSCDGGGFAVTLEDADTILIGKKGGSQRFTLSGGCAGGPNRSLNRLKGDDVFRLKRTPVRDCR